MDAMGFLGYPSLVILDEKRIFSPLKFGFGWVMVTCCFPSPYQGVFHKKSPDINRLSGLLCFWLSP